MVVWLAVAAGRGVREKKKFDFRGAGWVSGIGMSSVVMDMGMGMGNQTNSMFVEEINRKKVCFLEKWSTVLPRFSESISHQ